MLMFPSSVALMLEIMHLCSHSLCVCALAVLYHYVGIRFVASVWPFTLGIRVAQWDMGTCGTSHMQVRSVSVCKWLFGPAHVYFDLGCREGVSLCAYSV